MPNIIKFGYDISKVANEQHLLNMCSHGISLMANLICSAQKYFHIIFPGKLKMCSARKFQKYLTFFSSSQQDGKI